MSGFFAQVARPAILAVSRSHGLRQVAERMPVTREVVHRFVPGENVPDALGSVRRLSPRISLPPRREVATGLQCAKDRQRRGVTGGERGSAPTDFPSVDGWAGNACPERANRSVYNGETLAGRLRWNCHCFQENASPSSTFTAPSALPFGLRCTYRC